MQPVAPDPPICERIGPLAVGQSEVIIDTNDAELAALMAEIFADLEGSPAHVRRRQHFVALRHVVPWAHWSIWRNGEGRELMLEEPYVPFQLQWELNQLIFEEHPFALHAATVEFGGSAVVIGGVSNSGKSTFAAWLSSHGASYVADEVSAVTPDNRILSYPRPLGLSTVTPLRPQFIKDPRHRRFFADDLLVPVSALGGSLWHGPAVPIAMLVVPSVGEPEDPVLSPLAPAETMMRIGQSCPGLHADAAAEFFGRLADLVESVPCWLVNTADLAEAGRALRSQLGR